MNIFFTSFLTVFVAEMGDKTQLVTLTMASRYPPRQVFQGAMIGLFLVLSIAVGAGGIIARVMPTELIALLSGAFFILIGLWTLFQKEEATGDPAAGRSAFWHTLGMVFLAELGDKTQISAMLLAAAYGSPFLVLGGAMTAQALNHGLAIFLGRRYLSRLPRRYLRLAASLLFIVVGVFMIASGY